MKVQHAPLVTQSSSVVDDQVALPLAPFQEAVGPIFEARYQYKARTSEDLSFDEGERLMVIRGTDGDWWLARSMTTAREGYIPRDYVVAVANYEAEE